MGPFKVVFIHILIKINLQGFYVRVDLLTESNSIELIQDRLVDPLTYAVCLGTFGLGLRMLDLIELQIDLVRVPVRGPAELCSRSVRILKIGISCASKKGTTRSLRRSADCNRNLGIVDLGEGDRRMGVNDSLLINSSDTLQIAHIEGVLADEISGMFCFNLIRM